MTQFGPVAACPQTSTFFAPTHHKRRAGRRACQQGPCRIAWSRSFVFRVVSTIAAGNPAAAGFPGRLQRPLRQGAAQPPRTSIGHCRPTTISPTSSAWREERTISNNLTLQLRQGRVLDRAKRALTRELRRKRVTVVDYPDGRLAIRYRGLDLPYTTFDKLRQVSQGKHCREQTPRRRPVAYPRAADRTWQKLAASPHRAARGRSATCLKSAEPDPFATLASRHRHRA